MKHFLQEVAAGAILGLFVGYGFALGMGMIYIAWSVFT